MRKAGTAPCRAMRWSVLGWIWSRAAASSLFKTGSKPISGNSRSDESGANCTIAVAIGNGGRFGQSKRRISVEKGAWPSTSPQTGL